jgi:regulator of cell morphogenesis and NO signaling
MTIAPRTISPQDTLGELAATRAGASRVFHRHHLDFCCRGRTSLAEACQEQRLDVQALVAEIEAQVPLPGDDLRRWDEASIDELIDHVLATFHAAHRDELPRLLAMARKVETVHAGKPGCPHGLSAHLEHVAFELEQHMQKEEQVLFPLLRSRHAHLAGAPIQCMEEEHQDHGRNLARLRELGRDYVVPAGACATWTALLLGLEDLERQVMDHIHLENHVLFPRALRRQPAPAAASRGPAATSRSPAGASLDPAAASRDEVR